MKGKKAAGAAIRKDRAELEARAVRAELAERRLTGELGELRERSDREIHALRTALAEAKRQRDGAVNPLLLDAEERIRTLTAQLQEERAAHQRTTDVYQKLTAGVMRGAFKEGLTFEEGRRRVADLSGVPVHDHEPAECEADPQLAAFKRASDAKHQQIAHRLRAMGGELRIRTEIAAGGEA